MHRRALFFVAILSAVTISAAGVYSSARAQSSSSPMSQEHVERIRSNCLEAQATLSRIHASDGLLRVNRGQLYESTLTKLMAPFNGRVSANRYDSTGIVTITTNYERELNQFRSSYISYEESLSSILTMNCTEQPVAFYDAIVDARAKREIVHARTKTLESMLVSYRTSFESLVETIGNKK